MRSSDVASGRAPRRPAPGWLRWCGGSVLLAGGLFALYLRQAQTWRPDSDTAALALQAWEMMHGNVLLHGWWLADLSFFTTELPQYMLVESVRGLSPRRGACLRGPDLYAAGAARRTAGEGPRSWPRGPCPCPASTGDDVV